MSQARESVTGRLAYLPAVMMLCAYMAVVLRTAWVSDDAYITFRVVDNLSAGQGLTWNPGERVQVFTHPLWLLGVAALHALTHEVHFSVLFLSVVLSGATAVLVAARLAAGPLAALMAMSVLTLSKAYTDYSTSGLENPLTHLLLALFTAALMAEPGGRAGRLALLSALIGLNRLDALLLVLPALAVVVLSSRRWSALGRAALGFAPLVGWFVFAVVYYGFPFPNTAYAKLNTGQPAGSAIGQGLLYLLNSLRLDPLTLTAIAAGVATPILTRDRRHAALAGGVLIYLVYVVWIGGDFMSGRFLSAPLLAAVVILTSVRGVPVAAAATLLALVWVLGGLPPRSPLWSGEDYGHNLKYIDEDGLCDERAFYYDSTGLMAAARGMRVPDHAHAAAGRAWRDAGRTGVVVSQNIGFFGYFAGPGAYIVDELALSDALLARLPPPRGEPFRVGHVRRALPAGYVESLERRGAALVDSQVAALHADLERITRGPLWDGARWTAIWRLNVHPPRIAEYR